MGTLRVIAFAWWAAVVTALCFTVAMLALVLNPRSARISHRVASLWGRWLLWGAGLRLRIEGPGFLDPNTTRMIVANHSSYLDPPAMLAAHPGQIRFMLKKELMRLPFIGWYTRASGHFLIDRDNPREGKRLLDRAVERAKRYHLNPMVFPEGTRTRDGLLAPFKNGAFQLALSADLPVQPVAILGAYERMPRGSLGPSRGGEIIIRVGEPIPVAGLKGNPGRKVLAEQVETALRALGVE
ncbi:MAG: lysophospholipid acyltransferase family protein [Planctomycetota bacterium]|nr:lysophospholipid acyltransferase family protein [Planctomycetota bacterium]